MNYENRTGSGYAYGGDCLVQAAISKRASSTDFIPMPPNVNVTSMHPVQTSAPLTHSAYTTRMQTAPQVTRCNRRHSVRVLYILLPALVRCHERPVSYVFLPAIVADALLRQRADDAAGDDGNDVWFAVRSTCRGYDFVQCSTGADRRQIAVELSRRRTKRFGSKRTIAAVQCFRTPVSDESWPTTRGKAPSRSFRSHASRALISSLSIYSLRSRSEGVDKFVAKRTRSRRQSAESNVVSTRSS